MAIIESMYSLVLVLFFLMLIQKDNLSENTKYNFYGYSLMSIFITILLLHIIFAIFNIVRDIKLLFTKFKAMKEDEKNKQNKVVPVHNNDLGKKFQKNDKEKGMDSKKVRLDNSN
jgi:uncharacterized membrane protein YozB (DUF420 family)